MPLRVNVGIGNQWLRLGFDPFVTITTLEETEMPGKHPDTRIKRLSLTNSHGRVFCFRNSFSNAKIVRNRM
jgi:hypothetical protein